MKRYLPLLIVLALFVLLFLGLQRSAKEDMRNIPSPFIDKPFPVLEVTDFTSDKVYPIRDNFTDWTVVNFWASWCVTCRVEHPFLVELQRSDTINMVGVNYKDTKKEAHTLLRESGNAYDTIVFDSTGKVGLELGVYATPETFLVDPKGVIRYKHLGALTSEIWQRDFVSIINNAY